MKPVPVTSVLSYSLEPGDNVVITLEGIVVSAPPGEVYLQVKAVGCSQLKTGGEHWREWYTQGFEPWAAVRDWEGQENER